MFLNLNAIPGSVRAVAHRISEAGGEPVLVGGAVIDMLHGRLPKDHDIEVLGMSWDRLVKLFPEAKSVGAAFGILTVNMGGEDIDLSIPQKDNCTEPSKVTHDPTMTKKAAAQRRDFTINAMSVSLHTGELFDFWGGLSDLHTGTLRATCPELFVQDPLRAFRTMQLLARKAQRIDADTLHLIRSLIPVLGDLPTERIWEEFRKLCVKAPRPSVGMEFLRESGILESFAPELHAMCGTGQHPEWHPEGDVWTHALLAMDAAAELRGVLSTEDLETIVMSAFLHDVGKPLTTVTPGMVARDEAPQDMLWTAHGHDRKGMDPANTFLMRLTGPEGGKTFRSKVTRLVGEHMQPFNLCQGGAKHGAWAKLHRRLGADGVSLQMLARVCQCDACATSLSWESRSLASGEPNWEHLTSQRVLDWADTFSKVPTEPKVMGRHLIARGMKPGPTFGGILKRCLEIQDEHPEWTVDQILEQELRR